MSLPNKQISHPPIEFPVSEKNGLLTTQHMDWINSIKPILENTITNKYISMSYTKNFSDTVKTPNIQTPVNGYMTYNTDNSAYQGFHEGSWKFFNISNSQYANSTPAITAAQRDALTASNGDLIYNNDAHTAQMYVNGVWKTITVS